MKYYLGIDVGGTKTAYGLFDADKRMLAKWKSPTDTGLSANEFFNRICVQAREFTQSQQVPFASIDGIGIGMPSFVHYQTGHIIKSGSIPLIQGFPLRQYLVEQLGENIRVVIDNDGNTGALAELRKGAGQGFEHLVFCLVSTGIGSGIIINRSLFRGSYGFAGESGHMLINAANPDLNLPQGLCGCNNVGCFNSMCSGKMIAHHVRRWIQDGEKTVLTEIIPDLDRMTAEHIGIAYRVGDALATRAIGQMTHYIAIWLYNVYLLLNINCFVLSGGLLSLGKDFLQSVEDQFHRYNTSQDVVHFFTTSLGCDAGIIGAMELLFDY